MREYELKPNKGASSELLHGAMLLGLASILSKIIGTFQKIPLQNIGGDGVFGIYNAVYPFYVLLSTAAAAGIPIAISRLVASQETSGEHGGTRELLLAALILVEIIGMAGFIAMYTQAEQLAAWIGNSHTIPAIQASSYALLVIPLAAVLRGYEQGQGRMASSAISQVVEQFARVTVMVVLLIMLTNQSAADEVIAAGAVFGSFAGGVVGLVLLTLMMYARGPVGCRASQRVSLRSLLTWMKRIAWTAIPICLGALVTPMVNVVDVFTVPRMLLYEGWTEAEAMMEYGLYSRALPLTQLITLTAGSLVVGLVPAIAAAWKRGGVHETQGIIRGSIQTALLLGSAAAVGLIVLSKPINIALYTNNEGSTAFVLLSVTALAGTLQVVSAALLQGMGALRAPVVHLLVAAVLKIVLNIMLVPKLGIDGAGWSAIIALSAAAALNMASLAQQAGLGWSAWLRHPLRLALSLLGMGVMAWLSSAVVMSILGDGRFAAVLATAAAIPAGVTAFTLLAMRLRIIEPEEWAIIPKLGWRLEAMAWRLQR